MHSLLRPASCFLIVVAAACSGTDTDSMDTGTNPDTGVVDSGEAADSGASDAGQRDAVADAGDQNDSGPNDLGSPDEGEIDAGEIDAGPGDTGAIDLGEMDAMSPDVDNGDAQPADNGPGDTGPTDNGPGDTGPADAPEPPDVGPGDTGPGDATPIDGGDPGDAAIPDVPGDAGPGDANPGDAGADAGGIDVGAGDGGLPLTCDVSVDLPETNAGFVGGPGGSPGALIECPAGDELIGVAVRISDGNTANGIRSAVGFTGICQAVTIGSTVVPQETLREVAGNGQFGWTPATQSTLTRCPANFLVSGLTASTGAAGNGFAEVTLNCSEVLANGTLSGVVQNVPVVGSFALGGIPTAADCPTGQVVRRFGTRIGAGFDQASLLCGVPSCVP